MDANPSFHEMFHDGVATGAVSHSQPIDDKKAIPPRHSLSTFIGKTALKFIQVRLNPKGARVKRECGLLLMNVKAIDKPPELSLASHLFAIQTGASRHEFRQYIKNMDSSFYYRNRRLYDRFYGPYLPQSIAGRCE